MSDISQKYKYDPVKTVDSFARVRAEAQYKRDLSEQRRQQAEMERVARQYQREQPTAPQSPVQHSRNNGGFVGGLGYAGEKLGLGVIQGLEGIWDWAAGGLADLFGAGEWAKAQMENDWVNYGHADEWFNPGKGWQFVGDVSGGVGQMLPSIGASFIPGAGPAISTGMFMASAAGRSVSDAVKETGSLGGKEWLYGTASGAVEGLIEKVSGGIGGTQAGKVLGKQFAKSTAGKIATSFIGEGLEEVASDLIDPALRRISGVDPNATVNWGQLPNTFLVGGTTGAVLGGAGRIAQAKNAGGFNNLRAIETTQQMREANTDNNVRQAKGKNLIYNEADITRMKEDLSKRLTKMDETTRAEFLKANTALPWQFNADGTVRPVTDTNSKYNLEAVSPALWRSNTDYMKVTQATKDRKVRDVRLTPTVKELSPEMKTAVNEATLLTDGKVNIVVTDNLGKDMNGFYDKATSTAYISDKADVKTARNFVTSHEITHSLEGTESYTRLADHILEQIKADAALRTKYNVEEYARRYAGVNTNLSPETKLYEAQTEMVADYVANELLSNEKAVKSLIKSNENVFQKILEWIKDRIRVLTTKGGEKETIRELNRIKNLYEKALRDSVGGITLGEVDARIREDKTSQEKILSNLTPAEKRYLLANDEGGEYNENKNGETQDGREEGRRETGGIHGRGTSSDVAGGRVRRVARLQEKFGREAGERIANKVSDIVKNSKVIDNYTENLTKTHAKKIGYESYFAKLVDKNKDFYTDGKNLFLSENADADKIGRALDRLDPVNRKVESGKTAHISTERWRKFLDLHGEGDVFVAKIPIKDFLDLTADRLAQRDIRSQTVPLNVSDLKASDQLYLRIDFKNNKVLDHEGRHRLTALLNVGYQNADVMILAENAGKAQYDKLVVKPQKFAGEKPVALFNLISATDPVLKDYVRFQYQVVRDNNVRYSLKDSVEEDVLKFFGNTYRWAETGYIFKDGTRLDLSGRNKGAPGGYRAVDHREIFGEIENDNASGSEMMIEFMRRGNIRVSPERPGINLQAEPTEAQYKQIASLVEKLGWQEKEFTVDLDNANGDTVDTLYYSGNVSARKIVSDIQYYFKNGEIPHKSMLADFRYSLVETRGTKAKANYTQDKVYTKKDATRAIENILSEMLAEDEVLTLQKDAKLNAVDMLFARLNKADNLDARRQNAGKIADYIVENATLESIYEDSFVAEEMKTTLAETRGLMGTLRLDGIEAEITAKYGKRAARVIMLAWGQKNGQKGTTGPDVAVQELAERGIRLDVENDADAFFAIKELYDASRTQLRKEADRLVREVTKLEERQKLKAELTDEILKAYDTYGKESFKAKITKRYDTKLADLKIRLTNVRGEHRFVNQILDTARIAKDMVNRKDYVSAAILDNTAMKDFIKAIAGFKRGSGIAGNIRERIAALSEIYNEKNILLNDTEAGVLSDFDPDVAAAIDFIKENRASKAKLSTDELQALKVISKGIIHLYNNFDKVFKNGKLVETSALARDAVVRAKKAQKYRRKDGFVASMTAKLGEGIRAISDPTSVARNLDGYDPNGFLTTALNDVKAGEIKAGNAEIELMLPFEKFFKENKGFAKRLEKDEITVKTAAKMVEGNPVVSELKLTVDEAMTLYLTSKREQANIFESGITIERGERAETYQIAEKDIASIYEQFSEADKTYLKLVHDLFNEYARKLKVETDQLLFGYAKIEDTNDYIPIRRDAGTIAKTLGDERGFVNEMANTKIFSFNKTTKKGAKNKVYVGSLTDIILRHSKEVSMYYGLALPLKNFNKVYNKQIEAGGEKTSYRELLKNEVWKGGEQYFRNLFNDIQGMKGQQTAVDRALLKMRSFYSTYQLGLNPKTVMSQTASFGMAFSYLDADTLAKGLTMKTDVEAMYKYCPMTYQRMHDRGVVKAQGLVDKVGKIGDLATKPIQIMDNAVVHKLWNASQVQIEKTKGFKIGTEENLSEAGKLLDQVVRETQSNSLISERSAMNRSKNFLASSITMFMSDATKQISRLVDAVGEVKILRAMLKDGEAVGDRYTAAKRKLRKTVTGVLASNIHIAILTLLFRWLYDKWEKDDDGNAVGVGAAFGKEFAGNLFGMIPIVRDIYGYLADDFELNNYALSMVNDLMEATKSMSGLIGDAASEKPMTTQEVMKPLRQMIYAIGQSTGIPVRNVYNLTYGLISKFSPETAYETKTLFYNNTSYSKDIKAAVESGNMKMAETIARTEIGNRSEMSDAVAGELARLYVAGESVMPKATPEKIALDGEEVALTNAQMKTFQESYRAHSTALDTLIATKEYKSLSDAGKAKAVQFVEGTYYAQAVEKTTGKSKPTAKEQAAALIPVEKLAVYLAAISAIEGDKDKDGKTVSGSRKEKVFAYINKLPITAAQKYVLMGLAGYKNEKGRSQVESLIRSKVKDKTAAEELVKASGY